MQLAKVDLREVISKYCVFMPSLVRETLCKVDPGLISSHDYTRHENVDYERAMSAFLTFLQTSSMTADEMDGRLIDTMILITLIFLKDKRLQSFLCGKHRVDNQLCIDALSSTGYDCQFKDYHKTMSNVISKTAFCCSFYNSHFMQAT